MNSRTIGLLAGVVSAIGLVVQYGPNILLSRWADRGFEGVLPMFGTVGQTFLAYSYLTDIVAVLVTIGLALGLGHHIARRVDLPAEYGRAVKAIALGSVISVSFAGAPIVFAFRETTGTSAAFETFTVVAQFAKMVVDVALLVAVGAIAGAALTHFRASGREPAEPSHAPAESSTDSPTDSSSDAGQIDSRPAH